MPELINKIINEINVEVILRPHPSDRQSKEMLKIKNIFYKSEKFKFDTSENYLNVYKKCFCMITDISGTAYTYSFSLESPIIFYTNNKIEKNLKNYNYVKDRNKIGFISKNTNDLLKKITYINKNKNQFNKSIARLRSNLTNLHKVKKTMTKRLYEISFKNEISV